MCSCTIVDAWNIIAGVYDQHTWSSLSQLWLALISEGKITTHKDIQERFSKGYYMYPSKAIVLVNLWAGAQSIVVSRGGEEDMHASRTYACSFLCRGQNLGGGVRYLTCQR